MSNFYKTWTSDNQNMSIFKNQKKKWSVKYQKITKEAIKVQKRKENVNAVDRLLVRDVIFPIGGKINKILFRINN